METLPESLRQDQYLTRLDPGTDGEVLYVLADSHEGIVQAEQAIPFGPERRPARGGPAERASAYPHGRPGGVVPPADAD